MNHLRECFGRSDTGRFAQQQFRPYYSRHLKDLPITMILSNYAIIGLVPEPSRTMAQARTEEQTSHRPPCFTEEFSRM